MTDPLAAPSVAHLHLSDDDAYLREALRRCSATTYLAAREFRRTGSVEHLPTIIHGVIERFTRHEFRAKFRSAEGDLRLAEDLGLDSLSLMEAVIVAEEILRISIDNDELGRLRTLGDVVRFFEREVARD